MGLSARLPSLDTKIIKFVNNKCIGIQILVTEYEEYSSDTAEQRVYEHVIQIHGY